MKKFKEFLLENLNPIITQSEVPDAISKIEPIELPTSNVSPPEFDFPTYEEWFKLRVKHDHPELTDKEINQWWQQTFRQLWEAAENGSSSDDLIRLLRELVKSYPY
jgi:hypothetical protein